MVGELLQNRLGSLGVDLRWLVVVHQANNHENGQSQNNVCSFSEKWSSRNECIGNHPDMHQGQNDGEQERNGKNRCQFTRLGDLLETQWGHVAEPKSVRQSSNVSDPAVEQVQHCTTQNSRKRHCLIRLWFVETKESSCTHGDQSDGSVRNRDRAANRVSFPVPQDDGRRVGEHGADGVDQGTESERGQQERWFSSAFFSLDI
ncbi:hypothetical protein OGAPHI_000020 [Ogataea philodendri]|uniref:Uncharacterized protein n=1 Tax=Ogataea philodendri TaxID=1378263 RepID=A0A9P8PIF8_9ASCO|nr:uncharacterized protein OGAPHI_000020 [Ogataea philodendri]KAH3671834.1 hypothetical protein OGAPHI_000020 [Ogataea philodendri]